jgi:TolA-binding protein
MAAFTAGDYNRSEQLFAAFERDHATDPRTEDATFLRALSRARRGDHAGARGLAAEYLQRFPNGLRRVEMERLLATQ